MKYPKFLEKNDKVYVTAPSDGNTGFRHFTTK